MALWGQGIARATKGFTFMFHKNSWRVPVRKKGRMRLCMFNGTTFSMQGEEVFFERRSPFQITQPSLPGALKRRLAWASFLPPNTECWGMKSS